MFIVWGTKTVRKSLGRKADFCLLCRDFRPIRVVKVTSVGHLYYIPLGRRRNLGFEETCESCGLLRTEPHDNGCPPTVRDRHVDIETLISETNPDVHRDWSLRLAFEDRIRTNSLTPDERISALTESFLLANSLVVRRMWAMHLDWTSGLSLIATVAFLILAELLLKTDQHAVAKLALSVGAILTMVTVILCWFDGRRYTRRAVMPILIRAIRPLRPTDEEIETVLERLRVRKDKLGRFLKTQKIVDALMFAAH